MSWLARSLANSLRLDGDDDDDYNDNDLQFYNENDVASSSNIDSLPVQRNEEEKEEINFLKQQIVTSNSIHENEEESESPQTRGVKEDLNEFKQSLTRQIWGVASFLAPPPPPPPPLPPLSPPQTFNVRLVSNGMRRVEESFGDRSGDCSEEEELEPSVSAEMEGIGHDFTEIGGGARAEISKTASGYVPFGSEGNEGPGFESDSEIEREEEEFYDWRAAAIGITDEVLAFARNIAMHPETWLDFPIDEEDDLDDFNMSDAQREHALAIEQLAPRLAALRIELCPCHMSEGYFWKVYYVLLHSRLNKQDAEILSTPQVMEARAKWMQELHTQTKPESDWYGSSTTYCRENRFPLHEDDGYSRTFDCDQTTSSTGDYCETEKYPDAITEVEFFDKSVILEKPTIRIENEMPVASPRKIKIPEFEEDDDDWPDEEDSDLGGFQSTILAGNEEDISFSDLEDDGDITPMKSKILLKGNKISALKNQ